MALYNYGFDLLEMKQWSNLYGNVKECELSINPNNWHWNQDYVGLVAFFWLNE